MNIIVVGCGKIGTTILSSLVAEGHNVVALDSNPNTINEITNLYDAIGICGNGNDCDTLSEAGVEKAELFVAVTGSDEFNMLSCFLARRMGAKHTIARIRNPEYNDQNLGFIKKQLGLSMAINPDLLAAQELFNILKLPSAAKIETFSRRDFEMIELKLRQESVLDGVSLIELRKKYDVKLLVCVVQRDNEVFIPDGSFVLKSGDKIGITATTSEILRFLKMLGVMQKQARNIMILGGSRTAYYLSKLLMGIGNTVKIVEKDHKRCLELSETLPNAVIINGDGAGQELLNEEGLSSMDAFISLTGMDEENILISFYAAAQNVPKVISKVNRDEFMYLAEKIGLDCTISPKNIISDILVRYARALENSLGSNVETLYQIMDGKAEALEFNIVADSAVTEIPLKDMKLKPNTLIAGIMRGRRIIIPSGDDLILPEDKVVIITSGYKLNDISDILL
ncbi:MAG: Trk system potassium transporter TrkA [Clostridia bacterium]|nr:Trk system potassium transporter TrkA [Clostridia bacterium]MBQ5716330.1 Trk system potassium transporter TrkA [Clostridia bacterium]